MLKILFLCSAMALAVSACDTPPDLPSQVASGTNYSSASTALNAAVDKWVPATYEGDVKDLLASNCVTCHSATNKNGGVDLSTAEEAKAHALKVVEVIRAGAMPPDAATATDEKKESLALLANVAANWATAPSNFALTLSDITDLSYSSAIEPLNSRLCATCHAGTSAPKGVLLSSEDEVTAKIDKYISVVSSGLMPPNMDEARQKRIKLLMEEWKLRLQ